MREPNRSTSPRLPSVTLRRALDALRDCQVLEPRGLSCALLAWELSEREGELEHLLSEAHQRKLVERSGIDNQGHVLWRLTERGLGFVTHPVAEASPLTPRCSRRIGIARRPA